MIFFFPENNLFPLIPQQSITLRDMALFVTGVKIRRESGGKFGEMFSDGLFYFQKDCLEFSLITGIFLFIFF